MARQLQTLEQGNIYFFYRPKVEEDEPGSVSDVQRFYMVLSPRDKDRYRLAIVGRKRLPDPDESGQQRYWCFVQKVSNRPDTIKQELQEATYSTKTRGLRRLPAARPAGEGVYRILRHDDHTHLVYALELPKQPAEVQDAFAIENEASYIISVKNPAKVAPSDAGLPQEGKADYPERLQEIFHERRFADLDPPDFLDYPGAEFVVVAASQDVDEELGARLHPQSETGSGADIFQDLRLDKSAHPVKPLFEGRWE